VHGLNLTVPEDAKETIKPWDERESTEKFAESNVDDQLVVHIPFAQNVRIKSVLVKLGAQFHSHFFIFSVLDSR